MFLLSNTTLFLWIKWLPTWQLHVTKNASSFSKASVFTVTQKGCFYPVWSVCSKSLCVDGKPNWIEKYAFLTWKLISVDMAYIGLQTLRFCNSQVNIQVFWHRKVFTMGSFAYFMFLQLTVFRIDYKKRPTSNAECMQNISVRVHAETEPLHCEWRTQEACSTSRSTWSVN